MPPRLLSMKNHVYLGIDPGKSGGLVALMPDGTIEWIVMPESDMDLWRWLSHLNDAGRGIRPEVHVVVEKVGGYIKGPNQTPGSAMFNFGMGYGKLIMALVACEASFEEITPITWMRAMSIPSGKPSESRGVHKDRLRSMAQKLFPKLDLWKTPKTVGVQKAICDALLLAEYCRRRHAGQMA